MAPLLRLVQGTSFGIAVGTPKLVLRSLILLTKSVCVVVGVSFLLTALLPGVHETTEILARTSPNMLDFFIAIASGVIAFLSVMHDRLLASIGGVAMSTAILPPLVATGMELALGLPLQASGAFFLFLTNICAIVLTGAVMFLLFGFSPHQEQSQQFAVRQFSITVVTALLMLIPLVSSWLSFSQGIVLREKAHITLVSLLAKEVPQATLSIVEIPLHTRSSVKVSAKVDVPENIHIFEDVQNLLHDALQKSMQRRVDLSLTFVRTASIEDGNGFSLIQSAIRSELRALIAVQLPTLSIVSMDVREKTIGSESNDAQRQWSVMVVLLAPLGKNIRGTETTYLTETLRAKFPEEVMDVQLIPIAPSDAQGTAVLPLSPVQQEILNQWHAWFSNHLPPSFTTTQLQVSIRPPEVSYATGTIVDKHTYDFWFDLYYPSSTQQDLRRLQKDIDEFARSIFNAPYRLHYRLFPFHAETIESRE